MLENQAAYIAGWLRHIRDGSAADVIRATADAQRATDFLTGGGEEAPSFSGGVAGRSSLLPVVAAEHRPRSLRCLGREHLPFAWHGLAARRLLSDRCLHHRLRRAYSRPMLVRAHIKSLVDICRSGSSKRSIEMLRVGVAPIYQVSVFLRAYDVP